MLVTRTPYRISFFGGGTDYHTWYQEHGGAVLSTSISHYCYISCRYLPPFFDFKDRIVWREVEHAQSHDDIKHPVVKAALDYLQISRGIELHHYGDLPSRTGLGSSSAFTVGTLNALCSLRGAMSSKLHLACEAVHIERHMLKENVGVQDQIAAAYGGLNKITIHPAGNFDVTPVVLGGERLTHLKSHLMLFFTGVVRNASDIAAEQIKTAGDKKAELTAMRELVDVATDLLTSDRDITEFGRLLDETWQIKRKLSSAIAPGFVDEIYGAARRAGAIGGKLLGAGGGGFMLFFVPPEHQPRVLEALHDLLLVPFDFDTGGSQVIYYDNNKQYSNEALTRRDFAHLNQDGKEEDLDTLQARRQTKLRLVA